MELKKLQKNTINMRNKLVSIILPVYNGEQYLKNSIESCLNQTYNNIEIIIVNDASTDNSVQIIEEYARTYKNIKVLHNQVNKKLPASLNIGLSSATGEYLTWTSDDNIFDATAIEELVLAIQKYDIVYSNYRRIDMDGNLIGEVTLPKIDFLLIGNCIGASFLFTKNIYKKLNGYDENLFLIEDYDFWVRAKLNKAKFFHICKSLYSYRIHSTALSNKKDEIVFMELKYFEQLLNIQNKSLFFHFKKNILINEFSQTELMILSRGWYKLIDKIVNELSQSISFIVQILMTRVKNHLIIIYIAKDILKDIKIEANCEFIEFYQNLFNDINYLKVDTHKKIYLYYKKKKMNITKEEGMKQLLEIIFKEKR